MNLPLAIDISSVAATLSTSGVGSHPGNKTKKIGVVALLSLYVQNKSNGYCSTYTSPIYSLINNVRADKSLSGLKALNNNNLWKLLISLKAFGKSAISDFS